MNTHDADINYIDTYQRELSPAWLNYVAALHGCEPPRIDRAFSYLELGCGFGTSSVVHAACFPDAELHACDQRPAQIAAARQRDFATNRRFRRDVFVRADAPAQTPRALAQQPFGQVGDASSIQRGVPIPRGQLHLQPAFLAELTQLLEAGPTTIGAAVSALAGGSRDSRAIVRNVTLLMAAGALAPFARVAREVGSDGASPGLQRALRFALEHDSACIVPSAVLGHGVRIPAAQVGELLGWLASPSNDPRTLASLLSRLRLAGLIDRAVSPHRPTEK